MCKSRLVKVGFGVQYRGLEGGATGATGVTGVTGVTVLSRVKHAWLPRSGLLGAI